MEVVGWVGTALVIAAYYPQIQHLITQKCAWGISLWTWAIWLVSSVLLLAYAVLRNDVLFMIVQGINILAIAATIFLVRRSNTIAGIIWRGRWTRRQEGHETRFQERTRKEVIGRTDFPKMVGKFCSNRN